MAFNYLKEKAAFDTQWQRIEAWYRREDMSEAAIAEMKAFDWEEFKRTRINSLHETELKLEFVENLADKSVEPSSRYWWIEEIEDEEVLKNVRRLSDEELLIISMLLEGHTQKSISDEFGVRDYYVCRRMAKIKTVMKCLLKNQVTSECSYVGGN